MEQYVVIAKQDAKGKYVDYRILRFDTVTTIPQDYEQIFGPASLDEVYKYFKEFGRSSSSWFGLTVAQYALIFAVTLAFVWVIIQGAGGFGLSQNSTFGINSTLRLIKNADDAARILITFLVAVASVAIAFLAILTAMVIREYKERFALAKEVLTILVGILGTIVGFYFGTAKNTGSDNNGNPTPTPTVSPGTDNNGNTTATPSPNGSPTVHILRLPDGRERAVFVAYDKNGKQKIMMQWRNELS